MEKMSMLDTAPHRIEEYDGVVIGRISDYNSNTYEKDGTRTDDNGHNDSRFYDNSIISEEIDSSIRDSSDYQWFTDYSYRVDNCTMGSNLHTSILSSLCTSYGYTDMARDLDANLAQVDMEDFRTEDIHSFLHSLPQICCTDVHNERDGEMYASVSGSMMGKYDFDSSVSHHSASQEDSTGSIYKSEILFSPVKEVPLVSFSIDSLDCNEQDIMLTCQANKDNYTIAFEGSTIMDKSTDSHCPNGASNDEKTKLAESVEKMSLDTTSSENSNSVNPVDKTFLNKSPLICSESPYTTWSKLKENSADNLLKRQSSGNNNTTTFSSTIGYTNLSASCAFLKSQSLPNLNPVRRHYLLSRMMNHSVRGDQINVQPPPQPNEFVKIYNLSKSQCGRKIHRSVFQNNLDLISQFISHKQVSSVRRSAEGVLLAEADASQGAESRTIAEESPKGARCPDAECENRAVGDVFEDSLLVADRVNVDRSDTLAMSDSCSSFSSHSGRVDVLKRQVEKLADERNGVGPAAEKRRGGAEFLRNKYFDSAKQFEKELKKRKLMKKYAEGVKSIKIMDRSMQTSSSDADSASSPGGNPKDDVAINKPVYVMYPNYTLPDLSFLQEHATELDLKNIFLWPQKFSPSPTTEHAAAFGLNMEPKQEKKKRPCSCPDFESIRSKDYQHISDWESLMFLLPREYCQILVEDPELKKYAENFDDFGRSLICTSTLNDAKPSSAETEVKTTCVSTCSTGTEPSSGYRGSSTILTDSGGSPFRYEEQGKQYVNRPPLPRGILRNPVVQSIKSRKNLMNTKRYSMFELRDDDKKTSEKRRSLPTQFGISNNKKLNEKETSYSEDEGVDSAGSHCDSPGPCSDQDAKRLEYLLENAFHWNDDDTALLRNQATKKTVSFADRHSRTPPNSPITSVTGQHKSPYQMKLCSTFDQAIHEECESTKHSYCDHIAEHIPRTSSYNYKKELIDAAEDAVKRIHSVSDNETAAQIVLNHLCPALYAILNHGLKPSLETAFGDISNSVWQVVEASSQQGPMTRALHELVLRLNNEDVLSEGLLKFNAFIFGLLNVRGLDTWLSYLRTRESILRKHYMDTGIMLSSSRGIMSDRQLTDQLLAMLKPLSDFSFKLDLLFECRQLHRSLMQLEQNSPVQSGNTRTSWVLKKIVRSLQNVTGNSSREDIYNSEMKSSLRPRSCVDSSNGFSFNDITSSVKKRWSGIQFGSKLVSAFERLGSEDDDEIYSDSLDPTINRKNQVPENSADDANNSTTIDDDLSVTHNEIYDPEREEEEHEVPAKRELKFKQLQKKWEMLAEKKSPEAASVLRDGFTNRILEDSSSTVKSRIPRPVTSPVRPPSALNFSLASKQSGLLKKASPTSTIPLAVPKKIISPTGAKRISDSAKPKSVSANRSSRVDQNCSPSTHPARPSSLPQRTVRHHGSKADDRTRPSSSSRYSSVTPKYVRTLGHRLPSDNGHLSYNEGEKLRVVLEVDDKWILCCRGDQKGLVPRSAVLPLTGHL